MRDIEDDMAEYKLAETKIEDKPSKAISIIKEVMIGKVINASELSELIDENRSSTSRFLNQKTNITSKKTQKIARALGGVIRCGATGELYFGYDTLFFSELMGIIMGKAETGWTNYIQISEIPISILNDLKLDSADFIIKTYSRGVEFKSSNTYGYSYKVSFEHKCFRKLEFGVIVSPDREEALIGVFSTYATDDKIMSHIKRIVSADSQNDDTSWLTIDQRKNVIISGVISHQNLLMEAHSTLSTIFSVYSAILESVGKVKIRRGSVEGFQMNPYSSNLNLDRVTNVVLDKRPHECDVNHMHKLFEGADGKPYVELAQIIPETERTVAIYEDRLKSEYNIAMLCPMCAAKLKNGSQRVREEILVKLYEKYKTGLIEAGIDATLMEILLYSYESIISQNKDMEIASIVGELERVVRNS